MKKDIFFCYTTNGKGAIDKELINCFMFSHINLLKIIQQIHLFAVGFCMIFSLVQNILYIKCFFLF